MEKFEIRKLDNGKIYINIFQGNDDLLISNGYTFDKIELYELYIKLRELYTNNQNNE